MPLGIHDVSVTDAAGCETVQTYEITGTDAPTATASATLDNCGEGVGTASVSVENGLLPYTYLWNDDEAQTTATAINLSEGEYMPTITDANGCSAVVSVTVEASTAPTATFTTVDANCGQADGSATAIPEGGTAPYEYEWNTTPIQTTATATDIGAGEVNVTITDANDCTYIDVVTISDAQAPVIDDITVTGTSCGGTDGTATATVSGGAAPYNYVWSSEPEQTGATATDLPEGDITLTITDDSGCITTETVTILGSDAPVVDIAVIGANCGAEDGEATATVTGGMEPYAYEWSVGSSTDPAITGVPVGNYEVTVTDDTGCETIQTFEITGTNAPTATATATADNCGAGVGTATVSVTGGTEPYTYLWSDSLSQTTQTAIDLASGPYEVTVTDDTDCTTITTVTVEITEAPTATTSAADANCGQADGSVSVVATGGVAPYAYEWDVDAAITPDVADIPSGSYNVTVTDDNGCSVIESIIVNDIGAPTATATATNANCGTASGTATVSIDGGAEPYDIIWNDVNAQTTETAIDLIPGDYEVNITDAVGCATVATVTVGNTDGPDFTVGATDASCGEANGTAAVNIATAVEPLNFTWSHDESLDFPGFNDLPPADYTVTVTDGNGCTAEQSFTIAGQDAPTLVEATNTPENCGAADGSASVTVTGGVGELTYSWSQEPGLNDTTASGLAAGNYTVTVSDENACTAELTITIDGSASVDLAAGTTTAASCGESNGSATVVASAGTSPYTYSWSHDAVLDADTATGIPAGDYITTVTDDNGCTAEVSISVPNENGPTATASATTTTCGLSEGTASVIVTDGLEPYTYLWSDAFGQGTATATNLSPGDYTVTVSDANNCVVTATVTVVATMEAPVVSCDGVTESSVTFSWTAVPGVANYQITINGNAETLAADVLTYTEEVGENQTVTIEVIAIGLADCGESLPVSAECTSIVGTCLPQVADIINIDPIYCVGDAPVALNAAPAGGTFSINGSIVSLFDPSVVGVGTHEINYIFTDAADCVYTGSVEVSVSSMTVAVTPTSTILQNEGTVELTGLAVSGLNGAITYSWSPADGLSCVDCANTSATVNQNTTYTLTAIDEYGCVASATAFVGVEVVNEIVVPTAFSPNDDGMNDLFRVLGRNVVSYEYHIYNRWGNEVYKEKGANLENQIGWDGTYKGQDQELGVFVYYVIIDFEDGSNTFKKGNVTLVR